MKKKWKEEPATARSGTYPVLLAALAIVLVVLVAGYGGGGSSSSSTTGGENTSADGNGEAPKGEEGGGSDAAAEEVVAPFISKPSAFPVTEKLKEIPKGAVVLDVNCGTPICVLDSELYEAA